MIIKIITKNTKNTVCQPVHLCSKYSRQLLIINLRHCSVLRKKKTLGSGRRKRSSTPKRDHFTAQLQRLFYLMQNLKQRCLAPRKFHLFCVCYAHFIDFKYIFCTILHFFVCGFISQLFVFQRALQPS